MSDRAFISKQLVFTIQDTKSGIHKTLQLHTTKTDALRGFEAEAQNPQSTLYRYPSEFNLLCLGEFSDDGTLAPYQKPEILANASEFAKKSLTDTLTPQQ